MDNILNNSNISYHWIGNNIFKMIGILEKGILSRESADHSGIKLDRNFYGHNKTDFVSLCESPSIHGTFDRGAFSLYTNKGISFVINTEDYTVFIDGVSKNVDFEMNPHIPGEIRLVASNKWGNKKDDFEMNSKFFGEIYVKYMIRKEDIIGIMVPQEILKKPISEVNLGLEGIGTGLVDKTALSFIKKLKKYFDFEADFEQLNDLIKKKSELDNSNLNLINYNEIKLLESQLIEMIDSYLMDSLSKAVSLKYGVENPSFEFLINKYNVDGLPLYNTDGEVIETELQQKSKG